MLKINCSCTKIGSLRDYFNWFVLVALVIYQLYHLPHTQWIENWTTQTQPSLHQQHRGPGGRRLLKHYYGVRRRRNMHIRTIRARRRGRISTRMRSLVRSPYMIQGSRLITDLLRSITDPEHPVSLEQLRVVTPEDIHVAGNRVLVYLTPTIPHCSMSTLIGMLPICLWAGLIGPLFYLF